MFIYTDAWSVEPGLRSSLAIILGNTNKDVLMTPRTLRALRHLVSLLCALATLLCVVASLGVWYARSRINRAQEQVFERVDQSLSGIHHRLVDIQGLADKSKITVEEIQQRMQKWAKTETRERLATRFEVETRVQQLVAGLRNAELMLEVSQETIQHVHRALEVGTTLGLSLNADSVSPLLERIVDIKQDLSHAIDMAESLAQRFDAGQDDKSIGERVKQVATITARLLATFGKVDSRIATFQDRLTDAQNAIRELNTKTRTRIIAVAVCATLFLLWMAAGQICLWRWARTR